MRIISGKLKGRMINNYDINGTRPTMDRVKESIFSSIQNYVKDSIFLDLFAGTGNIGIEALSNGSKKVYFIDNNIKAIKAIKDNVKNFEIENDSVIIKNDYKKALDYFKDNNIKFDIIFLDPPYKYQIITDIINYIYDNNLLNNDGLIVCEYEKDELNFTDIKYELYKYKKYGSKKVSIFKR